MGLRILKSPEIWLRNLKDFLRARIDPVIKKLRTAKALGILAVALIILVGGAIIYIKDLSYGQEKEVHYHAGFRVYVDNNNF